MTKSKKGKFKVLLIDDVDIVLTALRSFLEEYKFQVYVSKDGFDGIFKAVELKPDIIFLDLVMPNLDGINMLLIKKDVVEISNIPVIVISANTDKENVVAAVNAGARGVISKPLKRATLIKSINDVLGYDYFSSVYEEKNEDLSPDKVKKELLRGFIVSFSEKKRSIMNSVKAQDKDTLYKLIHELKGVGGMIGHNEITEMSIEIETKMIKDSMDWVFVEKKCKKLFERIGQIERAAFGG